MAATQQLWGSRAHDKTEVYHRLGLYLLARLTEPTRWFHNWGRLDEGSVNIAIHELDA